MLLDEERYASVIEYGRDAVIKINEGNLKDGFESADKGWDAFPESGAKWLERMTENNDNLHLFDEELEHMKAKYAYENGELDKAFEILQKLVKIKAVSFRYFDNDDPKYKEFYKSRK